MSYLEAGYLGDEGRDQQDVPPGGPGDRADSHRHVGRLDKTTSAKQPSIRWR
jgi:hypothetical protein